MILSLCILDLFIVCQRFLFWETETLRFDFCFSIQMPSIFGVHENIDSKCWWQWILNDVETHRTRLAFDRMSAIWIEVASYYDVRWKPTKIMFDVSIYKKCKWKSRLNKIQPLKLKHHHLQSNYLQTLEKIQKKKKFLTKVHHVERDFKIPWQTLLRWREKLQNARNRLSSVLVKRLRIGQLMFSIKGNRCVDSVSGGE